MLRTTLLHKLRNPLISAALVSGMLFNCAPTTLAAPKTDKCVSTGVGTQKVEDASAENTPTVSEQRLGSKTFAVGSVVVNAHAERIWKILTDYNNAPEIFSNLQKCEVVEDKGANKLVRQLVHPKGTPVKLEYVVAIKETAPTLMEWHRQSGALKEVAGSWRLEPNEETGKTKVTYSIYLDGGLLLPAWLLRGQSKTYLPDLLQAIKQVSEQKEQAAHRSPSSQISSL